MDTILTKAKINIVEGTIELEGSEAFVEKHLEEFKASLSRKEVSQPNKVIKEEKAKITRPVKQPKNNGKVKTKKVDPESFEIKSNGTTPSLADFFEEKKPSETVAHRIAVIGYYVTKKLGKDSFSEGNIEFAYIALPLSKRPVHLRQACIDAKNRNHFLEEVEDQSGNWRLSRIGEIFVEEKLPPKS